MLGGTWVDGAVVSFLSNADTSSISSVSRQVSSTKQTFQCPIAIPNYNRHMQGVDRLDQLMKRFSVSSGHSFMKWHIKMAMSLIDIACVNAYETRKLVATVAACENRDPHRAFVVQLANQLISGAVHLIVLGQ